MGKKRVKIMGILILLIIIGSFVTLRYLSTGNIETILDLKDGSQSLYATRNIEEKTAEFDMTSFLDRSIDQNSLAFKYYAIIVCELKQKVYYDEEYRTSLEKKNKDLGIEKTDVDIKLNKFLKGYVITKIKMNLIDSNENKLFECTITGPNEEDNLIGLFSKNQSRFSFKLSDRD